MIISLNPTYHCNFRCSFCYLTKDQLADSTKVSLDTLTQRFSEIISRQPIDGVDLYGGEVTYLPDEYVYDLIDVIKLYYPGKINIITNFSKSKGYFYRNDVEVIVSWDYKARERWKEVYNRMVEFSKPFRVLLLASKNLIKQDVNDIIQHLNGLPNLETVEIKPYSTNQANQHDVAYRDFEEFVKKFITSSKRKFSLDNIYLIQDSINGTNNSFSDDHVYINPNGKYTVLEFDSNNHEYFLELDSFDEYLRWTQEEKEKVYMNGYCSVCPYLGSCLSEHLREVKDISESCNGFKLLLDWYAKNYDFKRYVK